MVPEALIHPWNKWHKCSDGFQNGRTSLGPVSVGSVLKTIEQLGNFKDLMAENESEENESSLNFFQSTHKHEFIHTTTKKHLGD